MTRCLPVLLVLAFTLPAAPAATQTPGTGLIPAMPNMSDIAKMTHEEREAMMTDMIVGMGVRLGLDEAELRAATPAEREAMVEAAADAAQERMERSLEERFGMPFEELEALSEEEQRALLARGSRPAGVAAYAALLPQAPPGRFFDNARPVAPGPDMSIELSVAVPAGKPVILVVADTAASEIAYRADVVPPFTERLVLPELGPDPRRLVIEVIDPDTRRVLERYRPVRPQGAD